MPGLNLNDPSIRQQRFEQLFGIYGNEDRVNQQLNAESDYYNKNYKSAQSLVDPNNQASSYLSGLLSGKNPITEQARSRGQKMISQSTNKALNTTKESLAQSGLNKSGMGVSLLSDIYGNEQNALEGMNLNLANQDMAMRQDAVAQLLGIDQLRINALNSDRGYETQNMNFLENQRQFNSQMDAQNDMDWGSILGAILGAGGQLGAAALGRK